MKRRGFIRVVLVLLFALVISACSLQKDQNIKSIAINEKSIPEFVLVGEFDKAGIEALVTYEDGTQETIEVNSNLLKDAYQEQINKAGEYEFEILFRGQSAKFKIKIVDSVGAHVVKFFNGLNELVSMQLIKDGEAAEEPVGEAHLLKGYEFLGWDRKFDNVKADINVYAIYAKVDEVENEEEANLNFREELFAAAENMRDGNINVLEIWEAVAKRFEKTLVYGDNHELMHTVKKEINEDREVIYHKYSKELNDSASLKYYYEKYDEYGVYSKVETFVDEFDQYDVYAQIKKIVTATDMLNYSAMHTPEEKIYKLEAVIPNNGDGNYASEQIEILFNENQIISLKRYLNFNNSVGMIERVLSTSQYFEINPEVPVVFPKDVDLGKIVGSVFNHDVGIDVYELRDEFVLARTIKNDANNRAVRIIEGNEVNFMWDKDIATYYTKKVQEDGMEFTKVYKTVISEERYGNMFYYEWKNLANCQPGISLDEQGRIEFMFRVEETSSSRAHNVVFIIENNRLVEFEKHYYNANEKVVTERMKLQYFDIEVEVPQEFINSEPNALVE